MSDCLLDYRQDSPNRVYYGDSAHRCVYLLKKSASECAGHVYVGLTSDFKRRVSDHKRRARMPSEFIAKKLTGYIEPNIAAEIEKQLIDRYSQDPLRICENKKRGGGLGSAIKNHKWTSENIFKEALKYKTVNEFSKNSKSAYGAANRMGISNEVCSHMHKAVIFWSEDLVFIEAKKYKTRQDFKKSSPKAYSASRRLGIHDECCMHMKRQKKSWSLPKIIAEAKKYKTRESFKAGSNDAYQSVFRHGIQSQAFAHMPAKPKKWLKENIIAESKKYKNRTQFSLGCESAYKACLRLGLIDAAFPKNRSGIKNA